MFLYTQVSVVCLYYVPSLCVYICVVYDVCICMCVYGMAYVEYVYSCVNICDMCKGVYVICGGMLMCSIYIYVCVYIVNGKTINSIIKTS